MDPQNEFDPNAILIRTGEPKDIIGYCPRYLSETVSKLLHKEPNSISLEVEIVNKDAPLQYRLKCLLKGKFPTNSDLSFNSSKEFQSLIAP